LVLLGRDTSRVWLIALDTPLQLDAQIQGKSDTHACGSSEAASHYADRENINQIPSVCASALIVMTNPPLTDSRLKV